VEFDMPYNQDIPLRKIRKSTQHFIAQTAPTSSLIRSVRARPKYSERNHWRQF
jgi:hypothetical protein